MQNFSVSWLTGDNAALPLVILCYFSFFYYAVNLRLDSSASGNKLFRSDVVFTFNSGIF